MVRPPSPRWHVARFPSLRAALDAWHQDGSPRCQQGIDASGTVGRGTCHRGRPTRCRSCTRCAARTKHCHTRISWKTTSWGAGRWEGGALHNGSAGPQSPRGNCSGMVWRGDRGDRWHRCRSVSPSVGACKNRRVGFQPTSQDGINRPPCGAGGGSPPPFPPAAAAPCRRLFPMSPTEGLAAAGWRAGNGIERVLAGVVVTVSVRLYLWAWLVKRAWGSAADEGSAPLL